MSNFIQFFQDLFSSAYATVGDGVFVIAIIFGFIGVVAQWRLYEKANQPGIASIVPIWNFIVFLRIVGRPAKHIFLFLIPVYGQLYMIPKVYIELCNSFGKTSMIDYILVILFNGFYILNLGLSYESSYHGPVYGRETVKSSGQKQTSAFA
jgi:signal peptidase I